MCVAMGMWFAGRIVWPMAMLVGFVVNMSVCVLLCLMPMLVIVLFRNM